MTVLHDFEFTSRDGLFVEATTAADSQILIRFFDDYDRAFILPNEKETIEGFRDCLALNTGEIGIRLSSLYGPHYEVICNVYESASRQTAIGGINLICYPILSKGVQSDGIVLCANLNYVFVNPQYRGQGYLRKLINATSDCMDYIFKLQQTPHIPHLIFVEQNDPFRLTVEEYIQDTEHGGIDQLDRLRIWARLGFRIIDFPYIQPPLSEEQGPDDSLLYSILITDCTNSLSASLMREHLERFFAISVLKGNDLYYDNTAAEQLRLLKGIEITDDRIRLLNPINWLEASTTEDVIMAIDSQLAKISLRELIR